MDKDTVNQDGNLIGRLGALAVIVVAVIGLGRVCGVSLCPLEGSKSCPISSMKSAPAAAPTEEAPAPAAAPASAKPSPKR